MKPQPNLKTLFYLFFLIVVSVTLQSQIVTDYDENVYQTVTIGNQIWMAENLKTTHYSDGTTLIDGTGVGELEEIDTTRYYFYYNDDILNAENYGCLYTWYTAVNKVMGSNSNPSGVQGVCPNGWHIPSDKEWKELAVYLGMDTSMSQNPFCFIENTIGELLKEDGSSGFEAKFAGVRELWEGEFAGIGDMSDFISASGFQHSTEDPYVTSIIGYYIINSEPNLFCHSHNANAGYSVRCLKDSQTSLIYNKKINPSYTLFPNPCKDYINIDSEEIQVEKIVFYSLDGRLVKTNQLQGEKRISISDINRGYYLVKIFSGPIVLTDKVLVE